MEEIGDLNDVSEVKALITQVYDVQEDVEGQAERSGTKIGKFVNDKSILLLQVIELLEDKLTSKITEDRARAIDILYHVFNSQRSNFFTEEELKYIVEFLHDRLKDQHFVIPKVILCLEPIIRCTHLPTGSASRLLNQFFREVNVQSHIHRHRRSFFNTLQYMLKYYLEEMKANCSNDFVMYFLQSMENEKDPRNLLMLFKCIPTILSHFPLGQLEEDFFEVLSCYFPVDFNPTIRTPSVEIITREDLASNLHVCLSHTNAFAKYLIPLILEKLDSSLIDAKLDSLNLFALCCERSYAPVDVIPHLPAIWHALRREIFLGGNEKVEEAAILFIRSVFKLISRDKEALATNVKLIFSECKHHLSEPELRMSQPTSKILLAIAESSEASCCEVFGITMTVLHQQFLENTVSSNRKGILSIMKRLVATLKGFPKLNVANLISNWDEVFGTWFTLLSHSDLEFVRISLELFDQLLENKISQEDSTAEVSFALEEKYRELLQEHLFSLIMKSHGDGSKELETSVVVVMVHFAEAFDQEFRKTLASKMITVLSEEMSQKNVSSNELNPSILRAVSKCSVIPVVGKVMLPLLLKTFLIENGNNDFQVIDSAFASQVLECFSHTVNNICCHKEDSFCTNNRINARQELIHFLCHELFNGLNALIQAAVHFHRIGNNQAFEMLTQVVGSLIRAADETAQQDLVNINWNQPVNDVAVVKYLTQLPILLVEALLSSLYPSVKIDKRNELLSVLLDTVTSCGNVVLQDSLENNNESNNSDIAGTVRLVTVLLNKIEGSEFVSLLDSIENLLNKKLPRSIPIIDVDTPHVEEGRENEAVENHMEIAHEVNEQGDAKHNFLEPNPAVLLLIWTIKSLAMKGHREINKWIEKLIELLSVESTGTLAAEGFATILTDCSFSLTPANHCNYRFLYKEVIFSLSVPKLIEGYRKTKNCKSNYIKALSYQLKHIPKVVLHTQLSHVVPLLVAGLNANADENEKPDETILLSSLNALLELFDSKSGAESDSATDGDNSKTSVVQYLQDLVPRLLDLIVFKDKMEVRIVSLKCLQHSAKFPTHILLPMKDVVVKALGPVLDDPKRLVRREAVLTRNLWILVGAPGGL